MCPFSGMCVFSSEVLSPLRCCPFSRHVKMRVTPVNGVDIAFRCYWVLQSPLDFTGLSGTIKGASSVSE